MSPAEFLTALWGETPPGPVLVWTLPDKKSRWYRTFDTVDVDLRQLEDRDIYLGAGLAPANGVRLTSRTRVKEEQVAGIAGLWADVDVAHLVHAKATELPPDRQRATDVLALLLVQPTILVDTGHGIHAWWLFSQPWMFSDEKEFDLARRTIQWWQATIRHLFSEQGWALDSTHDLSRLLRLPGTWNNKDPHDRLPVEVVQNTGERHSKGTFTDLVPDDFEATPLRPRKARGKGKDRDPAPSPGLVLDPDAEPPFLKMETLLEHDPRFKSTWHHKRADLPDQSPSGFDCSLANTAVQAGWPDQEAVNLLIAFRRKHHLPPKLRIDYYETTLAKCRASLEHERVVQNTLDFVDSLENDAGKRDLANAGRDGGAHDRSEILKTLSQLFRKVNILQIERFGGGTTTYIMTTDKGKVHLSGVTDVLNPRRFIERVAEETSQVLDIKSSKRQWNTISQLLLNACIDRPMGEVGSPDAECETWIESYLLDRGVVENPSDAASERLPLLYESQIHINLYDLMAFVHYQLGVKTDAHKLAIGLLNCGWSSAKFNVCVGGRRTTYRCWRCGDDYHSEDE